MSTPANPLTLLEQAAVFAKVAAALLIVIDPLGVLPVLTGLAARLGREETRLISIKIVGGATILLLFFTAAGTWVLRFFGITLADLRIGGGLLLLIIAFNLVMNGKISEGKEEEYRAAIVPLISPLLIGPGAITAAVVLAGVHGVAITAIAGLVVMLVCLLVFLASRFIYRLIGDSGADLISRIMGVLIATIAVSYIRTGVESLLINYAPR